jgi:hypothetical protein
MENADIKKKSILHCSDRYGNFGEGEYTEEGFLLYKGLYANWNYIREREGFQCVMR